MLSMLDHLADASSGRRNTVVHADRSPAHHAHAAELEELVGRLPHGALHLWYERPGDDRPHHVREGRADIGRLPLPDGVTAFLCGPLPFMRAVRGDLLTRGVAARDIHYEVFGPDLWLSK